MMDPHDFDPLQSPVESVLLYGRLFHDAKNDICDQRLLGIMRYCKGCNEVRSCVKMVLWLSGPTRRTTAGQAQTW